VPTYTVTYPLCGSVSVEVEADSEEAAIEKGWDHTDDDDAYLEWSAVRYIVQGNVFYGDTNSISVIKEFD